MAKSHNKKTIFRVLVFSIGGLLIASMIVTWFFPKIVQFLFPCHHLTESSNRIIKSINPNKPFTTTIFIEAIKNQIKVGSSSNQVEEFLALNDIKFSKCDHFQDHYNQGKENQQFKVSRQEIKYYIPGLVPDLRHDCLTEYFIQFEFYFDNNKRLIDFSVWNGASSF